MERYHSFAQERFASYETRTRGHRMTVPVEQLAGEQAWLAMPPA